MNDKDMLSSMQVRQVNQFIQSSYCLLEVPIREWGAPLTEASSGELEAMKSEAKERKKDISHLEVTPVIC